MRVLSTRFSRRVCVALTAVVAIGAGSVIPIAPAVASEPSEASAFDATEHHGSLWTLGETSGAHDLWRQGYTGAGVDIALIDSGVVPVAGLEDESHVLHGPDLSLEAHHEELRHLDSFGHGTHLAGIIAARDAQGVDPDDPDRIQGLAPDARLISIKVADQHGVAEITAIIAAIDWVIENRNRHGLNIRVLTLAFATDSALGAHLDPLSYAVEKAWRAGIVVVVAAGNGGSSTPSLPQPAANPYVLAVGALDEHETATRADDTVAPYSSRGSFARVPDLIAPGSRIVSLRSPGSYLDEQYPSARIGQHMFRGSGTSQAAAVVAGLAALIIDKHPDHRPDDVKYALTQTADELGQANRRLQGAGTVDARDAADEQRAPLRATQLHVPATGAGSLDGARGTLQVIAEGREESEQVLGSNVDVVEGTYEGLLGSPVPTGPTWLPDLDAIGGSFEGNRWAGDDWAGNRWAGNRWAGNRWAGNRWAGDGWSGNRWATGDWSANRWATAGWE